MSQSSRRTRGASYLVRLTLLGALAVLALAATASPARAALQPNGADLEFMLEQIKIAEAHAAGGALSGPGPNQVHSPLLPYGLRTVDGRLNNLLPGGSAFGAADQIMPRLTTPEWRDADPFDPDADGPAPEVATSYADKTDTIVADKQPRTISNLIVDQSPENPAAVAAAGEDAEPDADGNLPIPNVAPDTGLSAPFNSWFTLFGQFFDHGLDLTTKGGNGTVIVPLDPTDPLYEEGSHTNFMVMSRATNQKGPDGVIGTADDIREATNTTTSWVDQNQTYTSHPSHQVFLREYELDGSGKPVATGKLLDNPDPSKGGLPTWGDVKAQAQQKLGIALDDQDLLNVPLVKTDPYGRFVPNPATGFPQIVTDNDPVAFDSGTPGDPVDATDAVRADHAFLDDIAHHAVPFGDHDNVFHTPKVQLTPDDTDGTNDDGEPSTYDDELLNKHFITGDGRGNENIGLTSVHHVFHSEHNLRVDEIKALIEEDGGPEPADWQLPSGDWSGERLFQAARFVTEMEYQHLVFEEFARKVQPQVNIFTGYEEDIDPTIVAEFAHTVYRFGHSMLTESVDRTNADGSTNDIGLIEGFLNPESFHDGGSAGALDSRKAAGSVVRGMTRQRGNEIDEFVTGALRNNLVGLPLDLATINIARGRDTGVPRLNAARRQFHGATSDAALAPYTSWDDFKHGIKHPESLVNFIASYGTHASITAATTDAERRDAANRIVNGDDDPATPVGPKPADADAFLEGDAATTGVEDIDFWIGGLAEKQMPFGGLLGSSFNFVFETQMEKLQDGDRLYYLHRTAGLNFLTQLEENTFAEMIMRATDTTHLPADVFSRPDYIFEIAKIGNTGAIQDDDTTDDVNEATLSTLTRNSSNTTRFSGAEHVLFGGTDAGNKIHSSEGDDTIWGDGGDDRVEGGAGNDAIDGGAGNDILTDLFGDDNIKGGAGNDAINAGSGLDLLLAGPGHDFVFAGEDPKETFGGDGDDFIDAGDSEDIVFGDKGNDWLEGAAGADLLQGEHGAPFADGLVGDDVLYGGAGNDDYDSEGGDDVMIASSGIDRHEGMLGFDWVTHVNDDQAVDADLNFTGLLPPDEENVRDRFDNVEGLSGWEGNDILRGDDFDAAVLEDHVLRNMDLIAGIDGVLEDAATFTGGNIIVGGAGSDVLEGRGGNDVLDGDHWLDAEIAVMNEAGTAELERVDRMSQVQARIFNGTIKPSQLKIVRTLRDANDDGVDTAVFTGPRSEYDFVPGPSTTKMTVVHARGTLLDGSDTVRNVERLQFADQTLVIDPTLQNEPPTGTVNTDLAAGATPVEDQQISALDAFDDADGIEAASIRYDWQTELTPGVWASAGSGKNWAPGDESVGQPLRVVATFRDNDGVLESVRSDATSPVQNVNDAPSGRPSLTTTVPQVDREVTALTGPINDPDGMANAAFTYQWQTQTPGGAWQNAGGGTGSTFTPRGQHAGSALRVVVSYTDDNGSSESVPSSASSAVAAAGIAPVLLPAVPTSKSNGAGTSGQTGSGTTSQQNAQGGPAAQRPAAKRLAVKRLRLRSPITKGPISVTVDVPQGAKVARITLIRLGAKVRGKAKRQTVGTVHRTIRRSGRQTFRLTEPKLMRLKPGRYLVEVQVGTARSSLGPAKTGTLSVTRKAGAASRRGGASSLLPLRLPLLG